MRKLSLNWCEKTSKLYCLAKKVSMEKSLQYPSIFVTNLGKLGIYLHLLISAIINTESICKKKYKDRE